MRTSLKTTSLKRPEIESRLVQHNNLHDLEIRKARCNLFIKNPKATKHDGTLVCGCGRVIDDHAIDVIERYKSSGSDPSIQWTPSACTIEDGNTDAYGEMRFTSWGENLAKYARVHYQTPMDKIIRLLFTHWNLEEPKLLISVTGGAQRFTLKPRLKDVFRKGLVKAAVSTGAWISTGGFNSGVMKHVGEAIREYASNVSSEHKLVVLGISPWTMVANNEELVKPAPNEIVDYSLLTNDEDKLLKKQPLDPNHTHFILVDNAQIKYGGEIKFRGELESAIANKNYNVDILLTNKDEKIPIVVLVLEGGVGTIQTVLESVKNGSPCVFVEGSGKCADIFALALSNIAEREREFLTKRFDTFVRVDERLINELRYRVQKEWGDKDIDSVVQNIAKTLEYPNLLSVFRLDSREQAHEIDIAILTSLLKANTDPKSQLELALKWNRVDIARNYIFNQDVIWKPGELDDIMFTAINEDKVEFAKLLLENSFNVRTFLTNRCLLKLYNESFYSDKTGKLSLLLLMLLKNTKNSVIDENTNYMYDFKEIGSVIQELVDDMYEPVFKKPPFTHMKNLEKILSETDEYGKPILEVSDKPITHTDIDLEECFRDPEEELFVYCILQLKPQMAKIFWHEGYNSVFLAIIASKIFKSYASNFEEDALELLDLANEFEEMAVSVIDKCYDANEEKAQYLLIREIKKFSDSTVLQIAVAADDLKVVAHPCTQALLTKLWYHKIVPDITGFYFKMAISLMCPILAPWLIIFKEDKRKKQSYTYIQQNLPIPELSTESKQKKLQHFFDKGTLLDSDRPLNYFEKLRHFLKTPFVKFIYNQIFYVFYLLLFSYIMLCDFFPLTLPSTNRQTNLGIGISIPELVIIVWTITFSIDKIRQFNESDLKLFRAKLRSFFSEFWNIIEVVAIVVFIIGLCIRFIPNNEDAYLIARILFSIDLVMWYLKSLSFYAVFRNIGPKLVMIRRMMYELVQFIFIVIVFLFAFGVSTQALMYHNQKFDISLLKNVFFPSYFIIGGEYYTLETMLDAGSCTSQTNDSLISEDIYEQADCPEAVGSKVALAIYVAYLILLNILLVNLLIAIFSYTFQIVQNDTDNIWKFQRYDLIYEYFHRPILTPPFIIISYLISCIRFLLKPITKTCSNDPEWMESSFKSFFMYMFDDKKTGFRLKLSQEVDQSILKWESYMVDEYMYEAEVKSKETQDYKLQQTNEKVENLKEKIENCEFKIEEILSILKEQFSTKTHGSVGSHSLKKRNDLTPIDNVKT